MSNFGDRGPDMALAAAAPAPTRAETYRNDVLQRLGLKRGGQPSREYTEALQLFAQASRHETADPDSLTLDAVEFTAMAKQHWGVTTQEAGAVFRAADLDDSGRLNRHEFALLRHGFDPNIFDGDLSDPYIGEIHRRCHDAFAAQPAGERVVLDPRAVLVPATTIAAADTPPPPAVGFLGGGLAAGLRLGSSPPVHHVQIGSAAVTGHGVNAGLILDEALRAPAGSDWRGTIAAPRGSERFAIAQAIVEAGKSLSTEILTEPPDTPDTRWLRNGAALARLLGTTDPAQQVYQLNRLAAETQRVVESQPTVVRVPVPAKIFGDIHGQLRDLLLLFAHHGFPSHRGGDIETAAYVFNGDWVDRGKHQLDVVVLLFALKTLYPTRVFLVRGNHEFRDMSERMGEHGFRSHVVNRFAGRVPDGDAIELYERIHEAFDWLPLAAQVGDVVLVLHGGIGDGSWGLSDLRAAPRPLRDEDARGVHKCVAQALWSDPSDSDAQMARGVHKGRGEGIPTFGPDITAGFCAREGIQLVVRSHQFVREGVKFMHSGHLATLFSARNYFASENNDSALLLVAADEEGALRVRAKRLEAAHRGGGGRGY